MDVEAFVDDRRVGGKKRSRPVRQRQHLEIAADDEVWCLDSPFSFARSDSAALATATRRWANLPSSVGPRSIGEHPSTSRPRNSGSPETGQRHLGATGLKHDHAPAHSRIGEIMHEIQNVQHGHHRDGGHGYFNLQTTDSGNWQASPSAVNATRSISAATGAPGSANAPIQDFSVSLPQRLK